MDDLDPVLVAKFQKMLKILEYHLWAANTHLNIWQALMSSPGKLRLCHTYTGFFYWTRDAHVDRLVIKICVATDDRDKDQPSIHKLLRLAKRHPKLAETLDPSAIESKLAQISTELKAILDVRDQRSGHWDMKKDPPLPNAEDIKKVLAILGEIYNDIYNAHYPPPPKVDFPFPQGFPIPQEMTRPPRHLTLLDKEGTTDTDYVMNMLIEAHPHLKETKGE